MRHLWIGLAVMASMTACDKLGMGGDGKGGPGMSGTSVGIGTTGDSMGGSGNLPPLTSTTGPGGTAGGTVGCGAEDTAADPWGDEDGCDGGLPTHSPWDVGNGGSCWAHIQHWNESCEEEQCLDYDCHSPSPCAAVMFGECGGGGPGGSGGSDGGDATTGGPELEVDDPAALECILEALRDNLPIRYTVIDCGSSNTTYEIVANGLVISTTEEVFGDDHYREQQISTFNAGFDYESCIGAGVSNWEKRNCVEMAASGPCPVGPVACPAE